MSGLQLSLTESEAAALASLLDDDFPELSREISHTDDRAFRRRLAERRDRLEAVREQLRRRAAEPPHATHQDM